MKPLFILIQRKRNVKGAKRWTPYKKYTEVWKAYDVMTLLRDTKDGYKYRILIK